MKKAIKARLLHRFGRILQADIDANGLLEQYADLLGKDMGDLTEKQLRELDALVSREAERLFKRSGIPS